MARGDLKKLLVDLEQKARGGDEKAKLELAKVRTLVRGAIVQRANQQRAQAAAAVNLLGALAAAEEEQEPEEAVGAVMPADALDLAEEIAKQQPRGDDLAHKASLRQHQQRGLAASASWTRINPQSITGRIIGNTAFVQTDDSGQQSPLVEVANWVGPNEETLPITVTFGLPSPPTAIAPPNSLFTGRPFGVLQFGTQGSAPRAEVDIGSGTQLTISGSSVVVQVGLDPMPDGAGGFNPSSMSLSGMLSFYPIVRTAPVTRTRYIDPLTAASPVLITVPPFAKRLWVWRQSPKTVALTLFFFGPATAGGYEYFLPVDAGNGFNGYMIEPIIVAPDVAQIQVTKTAGPDSSVRCVFELGI